MGEKRALLHEPDDTRAPARKGARKNNMGTRGKPIELLDSDEEIDPQPGPATSNRANDAPHRNHDIDPQADRNLLVDDDNFQDNLYEGDNFDNGPHQTSESELPTGLSEKQFLAQILELFPDIAHDYVATLYQSNIGKATSGVFPFDEVLDEIVSNRSYPKERGNKGKQPLRELTAEDHKQMYTRTDRPAILGRVRNAILEILKSEFPKIPAQFIRKIQSQNKGHLYPSSMALVEAKHKQPKPRAQDTKWRLSNRQYSAIAIEYGALIPDIAALEDELNAARNARTKVADDLRKVISEKVNTADCRVMGAISEWYDLCFDETPLNRAISCNGEDTHYTCFGCAIDYIASEAGRSRCKLICPSGCGGGFTEVQLRLVPGQKKLVERLLTLQRDQEIREAGLDDVVNCPFCDYKQVCPDVMEVMTPLLANLLAGR
ncbi:hypothetical protein N7495_001181 [Penicillium taxi]|uniref:uncharacterized protein n=1 Tax=Penicillium taxi TaxID=168475 RepID=UPI002545906E|nr:uncharacterized protein N7495_001181 [Penicillium taxi]KAJ5908499.1 hypothetical protein N7495_001181 [Penicillium taxi]